MRSLTIAKRYAKATLELALEAGVASQVAAELQAVARLMRTSRELRHVFKHPRFPAEKKARILHGILESLAPTPLTRRLLDLLLRANRLVLVAEIASAYEALLDRHANRVRATVTAARPLDGETLQRLRERLQQLTGKQTEIQTRVDPSLLGGFRVQMGSLLYDASLRSRLQGLRRQLARG